MASKVQSKGLPLLSKHQRHVSAVELKGATAQRTKTVSRLLSSWQHVCSSRPWRYGNLTACHETRILRVSIGHLLSCSAAHAVRSAGLYNVCLQAAGTVSRQVADRVHQERLASSNTAEHSGRMLRCHWYAIIVLHDSCNLHQS